MKAFRILLIFFFVAIIAYTWSTAMEHGWDLFSVFVDNITSLNWSGQFNLDFSFYLLLSALWIAWRHQFSAVGFIWAAAASILGILFFAPYLFLISLHANGGMKEVLLGKE